MLRRALTLALSGIILGCVSYSKAEDCDYSNWKPIEVKPEQVVEKFSIHNRKTYRRPRPVYPKEAREKGATGTVKVRVLIDSNGKALKTCAIILPGEPEVDKSLIDAGLANVKQWNFLPLKNRSHTLRQTTISVNFTLANR